MMDYYSWHAPQAMVRAVLWLDADAPVDSKDDESEEGQGRGRTKND